MTTWAEEIEEDDLLPDYSSTPQEITTKDGERVVSEIKTDPDTGKKVKVMRTYRLEKKFVSKGVLERKKWAKYGASKHDGPGPNPATTILCDEENMQFLSKDQDTGNEENAFINKIREAGGGAMLKCRYCQENHFSAKCPYKDSASLADLLPREVEEPKKSDSSVYVPRARREGNRPGETMGSAMKKDEYTIRVSNLPETMSETDMQELCSPFGKTERIFLAKDRATGVCKGFAFVTYQKKEDAHCALKALHGYGYDHLILNVEWSKPAN